MKTLPRCFLAALSVLLISNSILATPVYLNESRYDKPSTDQAAYASALALNNGLGIHVRGSGGIALTNNLGDIVQFISYEGTIFAEHGLAGVRNRNDPVVDYSVAPPRSISDPNIVVVPVLESVGIGMMGLGMILLGSIRLKWLQKIGLMQKNGPD